MKNLSLLPIVAILFLTLNSCIGDIFCIDGQGNVVTEYRNIDNFTKVEMEISGKVFIKQGDYFNIQVDAQDNILDILTTDMRNNVLHISFDHCVDNYKQIYVYITMPNIEGAKISGSGEIVLDGEIRSNTIDFIIGSSGEIIAEKLFVNEIYSKISGSGNIKISSTETTEKHRILVSGSGNIDAYDLPTNIIDAQISGSGNIYANCVEQLFINISGSGNLFYIGNPEIQQTITGSGNVIDSN